MGNHHSEEELIEAFENLSKNEEIHILFQKYDYHKNNIQFDKEEIKYMIKFLEKVIKEFEEKKEIDEMEHLYLQQRINYLKNFSKFLY
jgi:hypothetical protein